MTIDCGHEKNLLTLESPRSVIPISFPTAFLQTILDVGCGTCAWLKTAIVLTVSTGDPGYL
jgi:hypothetical protein